MTQRLGAAERRNRELERQLNGLTAGRYEQYERDHFGKGVGSEIDWRVPRVLYCKDPRYNYFVDPRFAPQAQQARMHDGRQLEDQLGVLAWNQWAAELQPVRMSPPPLEHTLTKQVPFLEVNPAYHREEDIWERRLDLRSLDEAVQGDVTQQLPRPVMFAGDNPAFQEGRYLKDDCPIA